MPSYSDGDWRFNVNDIFATNSEKFVSIANTYLAAGWTIVDRSDGTTVSAGGQNSAANWNNSNAWERYRQPDGQRDVTIQRGASDRSVRGYYGRAGILFAGGTPTVPPTDATAFQFIGTSGSFNTTFFASTASSEVINIACKAVADGLTGDVFPQWLRGFPSRSPASDNGVVFLDAVTSPAGLVDVEPWVFQRSSNDSFSGWYRAGMSGAVQLSATMTRVSIGSIGTTWTGQNAYITEDDIAPLFAVNASAPLQRKGQLNNYFVNDTLRASGDTINLGIAGQAKVNWLASGSGILVPWPSSVVPVL